MTDTKPVPIPEPEEDETASVTSQIDTVCSTFPYPAEHFALEYLAQQSLDVLKAMKKTCKIRAKTDETNASYSRVISEWYAKKTAVKPAKKGKVVKSNVVNAEPVLNLNLDLSGVTSVLSGDKKVMQSTVPTNSRTKKNNSVPNRVYKTPVNIIHKVDTGIEPCNKTSLTPIQSWLKETHDYLYGQENIVGEEAMNDIMCLLFLTIIQDYITETEESGKFDLLNLDKYTIGTPQEWDPICARSVTLMKKGGETGIALKEDFTNFIRMQWEPNSASNTAPKTLLRNGDDCIIKRFGRFLTVHPQTKDIFTTENFINCKQSTTILGLLKRVKHFVAEHVEKLKHEDLIGEIYEYFINQYHKSGNKLGQFFTPRKMMMCVLKFKEADIRANLSQFTKDDPNTQINIWDPCMGTGGWLVSTLNLLGTDHNDGKQVFNINPAGNDVKKDTLRMGIMNVMNVNKHIQLEHFSTNNSLTNIVDEWGDKDGKRKSNNKHFIGTNPPFGASGKDDVEDSDGETGRTGKKAKISSLANEYKLKFNKAVKLGLNITAHYNINPFGTVYYLNDKNMPIQFLELCIHRLVEGGMCMIVLPYGELFFSDRYSDARTHLMNKVNITDIFLFPSGVFTHTGIKSCCLTFIKDSTGTKAIKYYKANRECNELAEIVTVTRDEINSDPIKSWYLNDYLEDVYIRELMCKLDCEWVPFGEVFDLVKGTLQSSKVEEDPEGDGVFITKDSNSDNWMKFKSKYDDEGLFIACVSNGNHTVPINYYKGKYDYNNLLYKCIPNSKFSNINLKYVYYYMIECKKHIEELYQKGACTPSLDDKNFLAKFKIPLPSMTIQRRVVHFYDTIEKNIKFYMNAIEAAENARNANFELSLLLLGTLGGDYQIKKLSELCDITYGDRIVNDNCGGEYPVYGGGGITFYTNKFNRAGPTIVISRFGVSPNCVRLIDNKFYLNDSGFSINSTTKNTTDKYLYYYLINAQKSIYEYYTRGTAQLNISMDRFLNMDIPIPPIEFQEQLIKETECFENSIEFYRCAIKYYINLKTNKFLAVSNKKLYEMFPYGAFGDTLKPLEI